jgi:colicin import membrane protein
MTHATYALSYDEQQAAKADLLAKQRLHRILQVRAQATQLSRQRARSFQDACVSTCEQLRQDLLQLLEQQREQELQALRADYARALDDIGRAHRDAAAAAAQDAQQQLLNQQLLARREAEAEERHAAAVGRVRAAKQAQLQALAQQIHHRQTVLQQERHLARQNAEQYRAAAAAETRRQEALQQEEEQRRRRNLHSKIDFRCEPSNLLKCTIHQTFASAVCAMPW